MSCREDLVECHDDCCERGTQFCNNRDMRCQSCADWQSFCGNYSIIPQACDLFCYKLQQAASTVLPESSDRSGTSQDSKLLMIVGMVSLCVLALVVIFLLYVFIFQRKFLTKIIKMWRSQKDDNKKYTPGDKKDQTVLLLESVNDKSIGNGEAQTSQPLPRVSEQETSGPSGSPNVNDDTSALGVRSTPDAPTQANNCDFDNRVNHVNHVSKDHPAQVDCSVNTNLKVGQTSSDNTPTACMNGFNNIIPAEDKASSPELPTMDIRNPAKPYLQDSMTQDF